jgi:hypothetical protein
MIYKRKEKKRKENKRKRKRKVKERKEKNKNIKNSKEGIKIEKKNDKTPWNKIGLTHTV